MDAWWMTIAADQAAPQGGGGWWIPLALVALIFYFVLIRPQSRERKQREAELAAIKKHDRVVTTGGMHATVVAVEGETIVLRVDDKSNVRIRFSRQAVAHVVSPDEASAKAAERTEEASS